MLPFPGLDGWQILVEIVEGSVNGIRRAKYNGEKKIKEIKTNDKPLDTNTIETQPKLQEEVVTTNKDVSLTIGKEQKENKDFVEWQIPAKVKSIMSLIGLGLLMLLMIFVLIKDIFMVF